MNELGLNTKASALVNMQYAVKLSKCTSTL